MTEEEVVELYDALSAQGVAIWIDGGWCIEVRCVAAEWMFRFKTTYPPSEKDLHDAERASTSASPSALGCAATHSHACRSW